MKQIQFDHTQPTFCLSVGVTEARCREMWHELRPELNRMESGDDPFSIADVVEIFIRVARTEEELVIQSIAARSYIDDGLIEDEVDKTSN